MTRLNLTRPETTRRSGLGMTELDETRGDRTILTIHFFFGPFGFGSRSRFVVLIAEKIRASSTRMR